MLKGGKEIASFLPSFLPSLLPSSGTSPSLLAFSAACGKDRSKVINQDKMRWSLVAISCSALVLWDLASAAPSASASAPPQLDERILFELARNPELLQIVNDYLDKKNGESPVSLQIRFRHSASVKQPTLFDFSSSARKARTQKRPPSSDRDEEERRRPRPPPDRPQRRMSLLESLFGPPPSARTRRVQIHLL